MTNSELARHQMVRQQVRPWDVSDDNVLALLRELPRDDFVPPQYADLAYADVKLPLPHNQSMMTPSMEGRLLQALDLETTDRVLEVGTGSGFLTACLARLAASVVSLDIFDDLLSIAADNLDRAGIDNVSQLNMDATVALPEGPFDAIAVTGSVPVIDTRYIDQLRPGGRLFLIVGEQPVMEAFIIGRGQGADWYGKTLFETELDALIRPERGAEFSF